MNYVQLFVMGLVFFIILNWGLSLCYIVWGMLMFDELLLLKRNF